MMFNPITEGSIGIWICCKRVTSDVPKIYFGPQGQNQVKHTKNKKITKNADFNIKKISINIKYI